MISHALTNGVRVRRCSSQAGTSASDNSMSSSRRATASGSANPEIVAAVSGLAVINSTDANPNARSMGPEDTLTICMRP